MPNYHKLEYNLYFESNYYLTQYFHNKLLTTSIDKTKSLGIITDQNLNVHSHLEYLTNNFCLAYL